MAQNNKKMRILPEYMIRPSDSEKFKLIKDHYVVEKMLINFPNSLHAKYSYERLRTNKFTPDYTRNKNIF